jgi:nucleoside-diphosphate-sugar epimerase
MKSLGLAGYSLPVIPVPYFVLKALLGLAGKSNINPCCVYSGQKLLDFGFKKAVSFEDGLVDFADWYKNYSKIEKIAR